MRFILIVVCLVLGASSAQADNTLAYLDNGMGARALGMGNAFVSVADDPLAVYWNPAGLASQHFSRIKFSYQNDIFNYNNIQIFANLPSPLGKFGLGFVSNQTSALLNVPTPNNEAERPASIGALNDLCMSTFLSYGTVVRQGLMLGGTAKVLYRQLASASAVGLAFDGGVLLHFVRGWSLGIQGRNMLSTGIQWSGTSNTPSQAVAGSIELGLSGRLGDHLLAGSYNLDGSAAAGAELKLNPMFCLRGGIQSPTGQSLRYSLGSTLEYGDCSIDYALRMDTDAALASNLEHTISVGFKL